MSPEAQRIAVAEACGWRRHSLGGITRFNPWIHESADGEDYKNWKADTQLPDYLSDLNAMHEAEKVLEDSEERGRLMAEYAVWKLPSVCSAYKKGEVSWSGDTTGYWLIHATAAQRAEAFLRTIGKWEEKP